MEAMNAGVQVLPLPYRGPQTTERIISWVHVRFACLAKKARTSNSLAVSSRSRPPRWASLWTRSSSRRPREEDVGCEWPVAALDLRSATLRLASSSPIPKGLVT